MTTTSTLALSPSIVSSSSSPSSSSSSSSKTSSLSSLRDDARVRLADVATVTPLEPFGALVTPTAALGGRLPSMRALLASSPAVVDGIRAAAIEHGHLVFRGFASATQREHAAVTRLLGEPLTWPFGDVLTVTPAAAPKTNVMSYGGVPLHVDGMFFAGSRGNERITGDGMRYVPSFQLFQARVAESRPEDGAATIFVRTADVLARLPADVGRWARRARLEYETPINAYFGGTREFDVVSAHRHAPATSVLLFHEASDVNEDGDELQPVRSRVVRGAGDADVDADAMARIGEAINARSAQRHHVWQQGDWLLADNIGQLHGRTPFVVKRPRSLYRSHVLTF